MKIYIDDKIHDSELTPIIIVFEKESDRLKFLENISNMEKRDGLRLYAEFNSKFAKGNIDELFEKIKSLLIPIIEEDCEYCRYLVDYLDEDKWGEVCGHCGTNMNKYNGFISYDEFKKQGV